MDVVVTVIRIVSLAALAVATGAVLRFYVSAPRDRMPVSAAVAVAAVAVEMTGVLGIAVAKSLPWQWWASPMVLVYSVSAFMSVWPALKVKR